MAMLQAVLGGVLASAAGMEPSSAPSGGVRSAGILYEVWHSEAATAMREVAAQGGPPLTTERVIRSDGSYNLSDVYGPWNVSLSDIWNVEPAELGFYCLYTARQGDPNPPIPDCPNVTQVLTRHARLLTEAGFDYIAVDITNWPQVNQKTDIAVLRPLENLVDTWLALRAKGIATPSVTVWPMAPVSAYDSGQQTTWQWLLDNMYNNPKRASLIWSRPGNGGKKTMFVTANSHRNVTVDALIRANGGRNDVEVIGVWALFGQANYKSGDWGFFSPCRVNDTSTKYTTSMVGTGTDCNQYSSVDTADPAKILEVSASGGYMLSQCALPFASPGHMRGLTLQRLFKRVLAQGAPNLFMSSFNEHIGGRQKAASGSKIAFNMGLPNDPQRGSVWVDTYASEFSRDIEPTVEGGSRVYDVARSCVMLYKQGLTCKDNATAACCTTADKLIWNNIWALGRKGASDALLTSDQNERDVLVQGGGWVERCHAINGPSVFCVDTSIADGRDGPFMMYSVADAVPDTRPLFRCIGSAGAHFFSTDSTCEGLRTESTLGYMSTMRGGETLRSLRRCKITGQEAWTHALDLPCPDGTVDEKGVLGFVR